MAYSNQLLLNTVYDFSCLFMVAHFSLALTTVLSECIIVYLCIAANLVAFSFGGIMNEAAVNIPVQISVWA